jgi:hypothetical protein
MRLLGVEGDDMAWPDGADSPNGTWNGRQFEFFQYNCTRHALVDQLGYVTVDQAAWDIKATTARGLAQRLMTLRTKLVNDKMTDSTEYDSTHVATATALGGGLWNAGSIANPYIQAAVMAAAKIIQVDTAGSVFYTNLTLVINPVTADKMARSAEIRDYLAQSPVALAQVKGAVPGQNAIYGLPDQLYGINLIVEDAVYNSSKIGNTTQTNGFTFPDNKAVLLARNSKDLVNVDFASNFSTVHIMSYQEMQTETLDDVNNRRHTLRVTDYYGVEMVAPVSGFLITNLFS